MTWPLLGPETEVIIQGMAGKEGSRMAGWMIASGTRVVAGVDPGSGGKTVSERPVFETIEEARRAFPRATVTSVVVPGKFVLSAAGDAIRAGVKLVHVLTERVPVRDVAALRRLADERGAVILGPSSVGYLQFPRFRLGYLGGENPFATLREGGLAVLSASGGMANETLMALARRSAGIRLALAAGGDAIKGLSLIDAVLLADARADVSGIAVFVEPGDPLLRSLIGGTVKLRKPLAICLPGDALESLPRGLPYGHAGTVLGEDEGSLADLRRALTTRGYRCTALHDELVEWCGTL